MHQRQIGPLSRAVGQGGPMGKSNRSTISIFIFIAALAANASAQVLVRDIPAPSSSTTMITYDGTAFWTGDNNSNRLIKVSLTDGARLDTVLAPVNGSDGLAWSGNYLWTISGAASRQRIFKIDPVSGSLVDSLPDPAQSNAGGLSVQDQYFWVGRNFPANRFYRISQTDGAILDSMAAPGNQIRSLAYDNGMIWATSVNTGADVIYWIDATTGEVRWQFTLPAHATLPDRRLRGVCVVDGYLWIVAFAQNSNENRLMQYDVSNAVQPDIVLNTTPYDFGSTVVGTPLNWQLAGSNIGNSALILETMTFSNGESFLLLSPAEFPHVVSAGGSFTISIRFSPIGAGTWRDTLLVQSNDPDESLLSVPLQGLAYANEGNVSWSPASLDFGEVWIPNPTASSSRSLMVRNIGHGTLVLETAEITGGIYYRIDPIGLPLVLAPQDSTFIRVWFEPTQPGNFSGALTFRTNDPDQPDVTIMLNGSAAMANFNAGQTMWTFRDPSTDFDHGINAVTWIEDVNGDGAADVLLSSGSGLTACVSGASSGPADTLWTYNSRIDPNHAGAVYYERALASVQDLTGDGVQEVIIGTAGGSRSVYALSGQTGEELWMFDTRWWGSGGWVNDVEGFVDINGDFVPDILAAGGGDGSQSRVFALNGQSGVLLWESTPYQSFYAFTIIDDVTGDGVPEVVGGSTGYAVGLNGMTGGLLWQTSIGGSSPCFDLERMGNANPQTNNSEDVAVASAYRGVYVIDGLTGQQLWFVPFSGTTIYRLEVISDITGDDVSEIVIGTVSGRAICLDGAQGIELWNVIVDPTDPENVLALTTVPDITGDDVPDIVCGTLSNRLIVLSGWDGEQIFSTVGEGSFSAVDAVGILPDVDGSNAYEILMGNRDGWVDCVSGGTLQGSSAGSRPIVQEFMLHPAYPNPFNPSTTLSYSLGVATDVQLNIYDVTGRLVRELVNAHQSAGIHQIVWNGQDTSEQAVATGVYFVSLRALGFKQTQKLLLLK